jgi:hypothetical protein
VFEKLRAAYEHKEVPLEFVLGMGVRRMDDGSIFLNQTSYVLQVLKRFKMDDCNAVDTPMVFKMRFSKDMQSDFMSMSDEELASFEYRALVGCLSYLVLYTRMDVAYAYHILSRFANSPKKAHCVAARRVLRYLKGTAHYGLFFPAGADMQIRAYADADFGNDPDTRRSHTGWVVFVGPGVVSWKTILQRMVALSSTDAEVIAAVEVTKLIIWLRGLLSELGFPQVGSTPIFEDNKACRDIAIQERTGPRMKHHAVRCHFMQQCQQDKITHMVSTASADQLADMMTKAVQKLLLRRHGQLLLWDGLHGCPAFTQ